MYICIFEVLVRVNISGHWRPFGDLGTLGPKASWHLSYRWGKTSKKPHPGNLSRPGIEPGSAAWQASILLSVPQRWTRYIWNYFRIFIKMFPFVIGCYYFNSGAIFCFHSGWSGMFNCSMSYRACFYCCLLNRDPILWWNKMVHSGIITNCRAVIISHLSQNTLLSNELHIDSTLHIDFNFYFLLNLRRIYQICNVMQYMTCCIEINFTLCVQSTST